MKIFFLRLLFILAIVFLEFSFLDILFPKISAPSVLIGSAVAFALVSGFPEALFMVVPLTFFFDIVSLGRPGILSLYAVPLTYATGFFSRRILMSHRGGGMILYSLFSGVAALIYTFFNFWKIFSFGDMLFLFFLTALVFLGIYPIILRFEKYAHSLSQYDSFYQKK